MRKPITELYKHFSMLIKQNNPSLIENGINPIGLAPNLLIGAANAFLNGLVPNFVLPPNPPIERHPYLNFNNNQDNSKYIIGTFPPITYLADNMNLGGGHVFYPNGVEVNAPNIPFFHGNRESLWNILFTLTGTIAVYNALPNRMDKVAYIEDWLQLNGITYSDIISCCSRKAYDASDNGLMNILPNYDLVQKIYSDENEPVILFNTSPVFGASGLSLNGNGAIRFNSTTSFGLFLEAYRLIGAKIYIDWVNPNPNGWVLLSPANEALILANTSYKCIVKIKIEFQENKEFIGLHFKKGEKEVCCVFGPSPAGQAALQLGGNLIYQQAIILNGPLNHQAFCGYMMNHFLNFNAGGSAALAGLNQ